MTEVSTLVVLSKPSTTVSKSTTTATSGSETLPISDTSDILIGMKVSGTNLASNTIVTAISTNTNITMSKEATASGATGTLTFTRTAFDTPTNPELCVSTTSTSVDTFGVVVAEEGSGTITLTSVGRSTLANCNATQNSNIVSLSSGNTNNLYVGQSVNGTGFAGTQARIERIISSTEFALTEKASADASNATYVLGLEHRNLRITEGNRIKCFDDLTSTGVRLNSINLDTTHLFVMIHSDNENKHHFAKVSEIFTDDVSGDSFEFRPKLGNEIAKDIKFKLFSTPISNSITEVAVGLGIKSTNAPSVSLARPLFYFFDENLDKKNQLDHNKKYSLFYSELDFISGATDALSATSFFSTMPDFGTTIIDYGKNSLRTRLIDNLKNQDNPATHTSNEGETILSYTPFSRDACFTNARRDANDSITGTGDQDYTGPYRYLSYSLSKDKANLAYNVLDQILYESMGAKGTLAEVKLADQYRILTKKIGDNEPLRIRHQLFSGDFNEFKSIGAVITSNTSGNTYATTTDHDLGDYLNVGDEVRVGSRIVIVQSIASISGKTQSITFRSENRLETESIFGTSSYTLANDSVIERRAYNKKDKTLLTDFPLVANRQNSLYVKLISNEFSFLYAGVSAIDVNKKLITLSFSDKGYFDSDGATTNEAAYHSQGTMLDYMRGQYLIMSEKMTGEIERIDNFKEKGLTQIKLAGRSNTRKLISPVISKNTLFSNDIIYSTQSPYNKLASVSANFTSAFNSKTLTVSSSITLATGDKVHFKYASGMMGYIGEISSGKTDTSFTLVDNARAEGTTLAGYKESNKNYVLNKALGTNTFVDSTTSLSGASNKGLFFHSGVKISSTGEEGDALVGSSASSNENAIGYFISDVQNMKSDSHFQSILEDENNNAETFDTVNTLIDFEIVDTKSAGENKGTILKVAPYMPLTLGRVDINYANTQDTTFAKTNLGKTSHDFSTARRYIDVDSDEALSAFNHIRRPRNLHGKPIYVNGKFLANIIQVEKSVELEYETTWSSSNTAATVADTNGLSEGMVLSGNVNINGRTIASIDNSDTTEPFSITLSSSGDSSATATIAYSLPSTHSRIYVDREIGLVELSCKLNSNKIISDIPSTKKIYVGMKVSGTGITSGTTVVSIDSETQITISADASNSNFGVSLTFVLPSGTVVDRLDGHHNQDATRETSKLTHELNLLNGGHLHSAKNISLVHPVLQSSNAYNITSVLDYRMGGEQPFHRRVNHTGTNASNKALNNGGVDKLDEFGTYQSNFGASNYRIINLERGNYNKSKHLNFMSKEIFFYTETASKIKYYASAYRFNTGYYTDGFLQNNIVGTDICGMNIIGQGQIETFSGSPYVEITIEDFIAGDANTFHFDVFKLGQKIVASGIPDNTFVGNRIGVEHNSGDEGEIRLVDLSANAVNATASASGVNAKFFEFDNKRLIESRGYLPSIGDKFYDTKVKESKMNGSFGHETGYKKGGYLPILFTPYPQDIVNTDQSTSLRNTLHFKDKLEQIDPKIARMFLFSNSDLLPYSSTRKDSLLNKNKTREVSNYSLLTINSLRDTGFSEEKEAIEGKTTTLSALDDTYQTHNIISANDGKKINELRRFSIMRLTEVVVDFMYNQFDPENAPSQDRNIGTLPRYSDMSFSSVEDSSNNDLCISSVSGKVVNTVRADTGAAASANNLVQNDVLLDGAGRFIGIVDSVGTNLINLRRNACKTDLDTSSDGDFYSPRIATRAGSTPNGLFMTLRKIDFEKFNEASSSNTGGSADIKGLATENSLVEVDGVINLLQMGVMRGLASSGGSYLTSNPPNRGNLDSGYGGDNSTYTDTTFATTKGISAIRQVDNLFEDNTLILPIGLPDGAYYSFVSAKITAGSHSAGELLSAGHISPILGAYAQTYPTITGSNSPIGSSGNSVYLSGSPSSASLKQSHEFRMLQNHIPIFLGRYKITGGRGAEAVVGMTGTKIAATMGIDIDGTKEKEIRFGATTGTITSSNTFEHAGFSSKRKSTDTSTGADALTYDNDADGVFAGFKPTLKIDVGYTVNGNFNTGASTKAKFEDTDSKVESGQNISGTSFPSLYVDSVKVPKFTRIYGTISGTSPPEILMTANATSSGADGSVRVSRNRVGQNDATNGTTITTLAFTDSHILHGEITRGSYNAYPRSDNPHWLSFVDLTGCYLVSEEFRSLVDSSTTGETIVDENASSGGSHGLGSSVNMERYSLNNGTPKYILHVISHEIDTTRQDRTHIITVSGTFPDAATDKTTDNGRFKSFRIMQPNHTCFYDFSPKKIRINQLSSKYTKKPNEDSTYLDPINHFMFRDAPSNHTQEGSNEAVLSMYVVVDPDGQSSDGNLVVESPVNLRNNIMTEGKLLMNLSDGDNNNLTNVAFNDGGNTIEFDIELEEQKELLGVVSVSETIDLLVNSETTDFGKRALIGSVVSVAQDSDKLINEILEENDIEFNLTSSSYPYFVAPNYRGVDLFSAIKFLMNKKDKILIEDNGVFTIEDSDSSNFHPQILFTTQNSDTQIYAYSREKSMFDFYNEIIVYGKNHRAIRKELNSIKKKGRKTLQVFENELITQNDVDKRATELLKLHNDESFGLKINVGHKGISQLRVGDVVTVEIPQENIPRSEFIVLEIQHNLSGTMDLELGSYTKGLEDRFAELAIASNSLNNKVRENSFNDSEFTFDFLKNIDIKPIKFLARKKSVPSGSYTLGTNTTDSKTLNTNTDTLNIGVVEFTTLVEEEF